MSNPLSIRYENNSFDIMCTDVFDPSKEGCLEKVSEANEEIEKLTKNKKKKKEKPKATSQNTEEDKTAENEEWVECLSKAFESIQNLATHIKTENTSKRDEEFVYFRLTGTCWVKRLIPTPI